MPKIEEILSAEQLAAVRALENGEAVLQAISSSAGSSLIDNRQGKYVDKSTGMYIPKTKFDEVNNAKNIAESALTQYQEQVKVEINDLKTKNATLKTEYENKLTRASKTRALEGVMGMSDKLGGKFFAHDVARDLLLDDADFMTKIELDEKGEVKNADAVVTAIKEHGRVGKLITQGNLGGSGSGGSGSGGGAPAEELVAAEKRYDEAKTKGDRKAMMKAQNDVLRLKELVNNK